MVFSATSEGRSPTEGMNVSYTQTFLGSLDLTVNLLLLAFIGEDLASTGNGKGFYRSSGRKL